MIYANTSEQFGFATLFPSFYRHIFDMRYYRLEILIEINNTWYGIRIGNVPAGRFISYFYGLDNNGISIHHVTIDKPLNELTDMNF